MKSGGIVKTTGANRNGRSRAFSAKARTEASESHAKDKDRDDTVKKEKKIFISWSGDVSKKVAIALKECLEKNIFKNDNVVCFVSELDIASGTDWWNKIKDELRSSQAGIVCITKENLDSAWLFFEAGALVTQEVPTIPLLIHCSSNVLTNTPLSRKQAIDFCDRERFQKMIADLRGYVGLKELEERALQTIVNPAYMSLKVRLESVLKRLESTSVFSKKYVYPPEVDIVNHKTIYISVPMSSISEEKYEEIKKYVNELKPLLYEIGFVEVICPIFDVERIKNFEGKTIAIKNNFPNMKKVDSMLVIYPYPTPSSTLVEIGYAIALSKKIVIFHGGELPYMLEESGETISNIRTYGYNKFGEIKDIIRKNRMSLFEGGTQLV